MLKKVIVRIESGIGKRFLSALRMCLEKAGIEMEMDTDKGSEAEKAVLYITDNPDSIREKYGFNCCILLYITEQNRNMWWSDIPYAVESLENPDAEFLERVYRRHIGEPWTILETDRLIVREMREEDLDAICRIYDQPGIGEFVTPLKENREEQLQIIKSYICNVYPIYGFGMWMLVEKASGKCIGRIGLQMENSIAGTKLEKCNTEFKEKICPELGFIIEKSAQRKGYCLEGCRAVLDYGFEELELDEIRAVVKRENVASMEFCCRLGGMPEEVEGYTVFRWHRMTE